MSLSPATETHAVDPEKPWLGLASFTEETRAYFHGRDEEVAELGRRVQRKLLTILFGQSGLGKTSILRAGIVPRLRPEGYCPVYVRLDYGRESPPPSEQIKQAILRATQVAGHWTQPGVSAQGESLWEFLHHRDDILRDRTGRALIPLLIFDQFEEIFTLAQGDDFGRQRAAQFLEDLADLVENRAPRALEARLDADEAGMERFDFTRADYRILLALREDYLAHLESLKGTMPSVTQNRMRLARMTGAQALAAVTRPGRALVSDDVAKQIVTFVSGAADLATAEVEPSLLSLVCRELNETRRTRGHAEISADLLAGSRATILAEFYERTLADQPAGVRAFIEDELLTDSGYRESIAEERVKKGFAAAGASPASLAALIDRRLLRVEERLDVRRVELTHDVLVGVVKASRDVRQERESKAAMQRQLAETKAKEAATHAALLRARMIATVCGLLAVGAAGSAIFGYLSMKRAQTAERLAVSSAEAARQAQAQEVTTRQLAESARGEAEKLVGFLVDDFYRELQPTGRLEIVATLAGRAAQYYRDLPAALRTPETERNRGLTLARYGATLNAANKTDAAAPVVNEAVVLLESLHANGDASAELATGLASALGTQGLLLQNQGLYNEALPAYQRAVDVLRPPATALGASRVLRLDFATALHSLGFQHSRTTTIENALPAWLECKLVLESLGAADSEETHMVAAYALINARLSAAASNENKLAEARAFVDESLASYQRVLELNPGYISAINGRGIAHGYLANVLRSQGSITEALEASRLSEQDYETNLRLNPSSGTGWSNLALSRSRNANLLASLGRFSEAKVKLRATLALESKVTMSSAMAASFSGYAWNLVLFEAQTGNAPAAEATLAEFRRFYASSLKDTAAEGFARQMQAAMTQSVKLTALEGVGGRAQEMYDLARQLLPQLEPLAPKDEGNRIWRDGILAATRVSLANSALRLGKFSEAESAARDAGSYWLQRGIKNSLERLSLCVPQTVQALAIARQGRPEEARKLIDSVLEVYREEPAALREDSVARSFFARALFTSAVAQPATARAERQSLLTEAVQVVDSLSAETQQLQWVKELRGWIADERAK